MICSRDRKYYFKDWNRAEGGGLGKEGKVGGSGVQGVRHPLFGGVVLF